VARGLGLLIFAARRSPTHRSRAWHQNPLPVSSERCMFTCLPTWWPLLSLRCLFQGCKRARIVPAHSTRRLCFLLTLFPFMELRATADHAGGVHVVHVHAAPCYAVAAPSTARDHGRRAAG